ncbi:hypothetical protein BGX21_005058, partial [Mortierella sp. AD011]
MAKASRRYPHFNLGPRLKASETGSIGLADFNDDIEYYGSVKIGTPGQIMRFDFDTGSADIWFPSVYCKAAACNNHKRFNPAKSRTYRRDGRPWEIGYDDNSGASGILGSDIVDVGGIKVRQIIGLSTVETADFKSDPPDGMFGLAFQPEESVKGVKTFMENAIAAGVIAKPIFSAFLPSKRRNGGQHGSYLFGAIDRSRYIGELTYVPVTKKDYWQIHVSNVKVEGKSLNIASEVIIDTGTTIVLVGDTAAAAIHNNIRGSRYSKKDGGWILPCSVRNSKGSASFTIGGKDFHVPFADIVDEPIDQGSDMCSSNIQGGEDGVWTLGDVFIKNNYCVFDHSHNPSVGIAPL